MISASERIDYCPAALAGEVIQEYGETADIMFYGGTGEGITLHGGKFMLLFPEDAHTPQIKVSEGSIKKLVVKIKV